MKDKCCGYKVHAQVEYTNKKFQSVESLIGMDLNDAGDRKLAHAILEEWMKSRREPACGPDHFVIYAKFPVS